MKEATSWSLMQPQSDKDWEKCYQDFCDSRNPETKKFVMTAVRLEWFKAQEYWYQRRGACDGMSDTRLLKLKSLGFFPHDKPVSPTRDVGSVSAAATSADAVMTPPVAKAPLPQTSGSSDQKAAIAPAESGSLANDTQQPRVQAEAAVSMTTAAAASPSQSRQASPGKLTPEIKAAFTKHALMTSEQVAIIQSDAATAAPKLVTRSESSYISGAKSSGPNHDSERRVGDPGVPTQTHAVSSTSESTASSSTVRVSSQERVGLTSKASSSPIAFADTSAPQTCDLPTVDTSSWILPHGQEKHCCLQHTQSGGCPNKHACNKIHMQYPWGNETMDMLWSLCDQRLPTSVEPIYNERVLTLSAFAGGQWWYTAKYLSDSLDVSAIDKKIVLVEGGSTARRSEQGIYWYPTDSDAKDALQRTVIVTYCATENCVQADQQARGPAIDTVAKRIAEATQGRTAADENGTKKRPLARGPATAMNAYGPSKISRVGGITDKSSRNVEPMVHRNANSSVSHRDKQPILQNTRKENPHVKNYQFNPIFYKYQTAPKLRSNSVPPTVRYKRVDEPMCVSYHVRGLCHSTCKRKYDHHPHTAEEDEQLLRWCVCVFSTTSENGTDMNVV